MAIELCIRDLKMMTEGTLKFGLTPPLGGECEPICRLVRAGKTLRNGDVVISQHELEESNHAKQHFAEEAYFHGALGVISHHEVCPGNGGFGLQVDDIEVAMWRIVAALRDQTKAPTIAVFDERTDSPVVNQLKSGGLACESELPLAWQCLEWQSAATLVVHIKESHCPLDSLFGADHRHNNFAIVTDHIAEELVPQIQSEEINGKINLLSDAPADQLASIALRQIEGRNLA